MAALTSVGVVAAALPAYADRVVVQGTAFPDPARTNLSFVGCDDLYQRGDEPVRPTVDRGPGEAPLGTRSLGFDLGGGNAVGALFTVASVLGTSTASVAVNAAGQARGVAYAGYQEPADAGTDLLWLGRSELSTPGGAWQTVDATTRSYVWSKYDMATRTVVAAGPGVATSVADFAAAHGGDGPGLFTVGFGCDGTAFSMDALSVGSGADTTTYDLEGLRTRVEIDADRLTASSGRAVSITGTLATGTGDPVPHATMVLERRYDGQRAWEPIAVVPVGPGGTARARVEPDAEAAYRWRFVDRPLAEGATSGVLVLDVLPTLETEEPTPSPSPTLAHPAAHGVRVRRRRPRRPTPAPSPTPSAVEPTPVARALAHAGRARLVGRGQPDRSRDR